MADARARAPDTLASVRENACADCNELVIIYAFRASTVNHVVIKDLRGNIGYTFKQIFRPTRNVNVIKCIVGFYICYTIICGM